MHLRLGYCVELLGHAEQSYSMIMTLRSKSSTVVQCIKHHGENLTPPTSDQKPHPPLTNPIGMYTHLQQTGSMALGMGHLQLMANAQNANVELEMHFVPLPQPLDHVGSDI